MVIPSCGHWVQYEHPDLFIKFVSEFMQGVWDIEST